MNLILISISAVLSYLHLYIADNRTSWYCLVLERNIIILLFAIVLYRVVPFKHGRMKRILKFNLEFWIIRILVSSLDTIFLFLNIDFQTLLLLLGYFPIVYILVRISLELRGL